MVKHILKLPKLWSIIIANFFPRFFEISPEKGVFMNVETLISGVLSLRRQLSLIHTILGRIRHLQYSPVFIVPTVVPQNFRLTGRARTRGVDPDKTVRFKWTPVDSSVAAVRGQFRGYRVSNRHSRFSIVARLQRAFRRLYFRFWVASEIPPSTFEKAILSILANDRGNVLQNSRLRFKTGERNFVIKCTMVDFMKQHQNVIVISWWSGNGTSDEGPRYL